MNLKTSAFALISFGLLASCSQPIKTDTLSCDFTNGSGVFLADNVFTATPAELKQVVFLSKRIEKQVEVCGHVIRSQSGLRLEMTVVNTKKEPVQVELKSFFYQANGTPSEPESSWTRLMLPALGKSQYTINSSSRIPPSYLTVQLGAGS